MSQYTTLKAALIVDIKAAWSGVTVAFGRPLLPFTSMPRAVVTLGKVTYRKSGMRSMDKTWPFQIAASFELTDVVGAAELEPVQISKIELFIAQFLPETDDGTVPTAAGAYAGITNRFLITGFEAVEPGPEDEAYVVTIDLEIVTEVHV